MPIIHISRNRQPLGRFSLREVAEGLQTGRFLPTDLAWREGMESWVPLSDFADLKSESAGGAPGVPPPEIPPAPAGPSVPEPAWERRQELGVAPAAVETVKQVLTNPMATFSAMPRSGGLGGPLLFNLLLSWIGSGVALVYQSIWTMVNPAAVQEELGGVSMAVFWVVMGVLLVFLPVFILVFAFIGAGILHLCLWAVGGAKQTFETTFRVVCYAHGATSILQLIPLCGGLAYSVWNLVASIIGLSKAHEIEVWRAVVAVLLPVLLCCGLVFGIVVAAAGFGVSALPTQ